MLASIANTKVIPRDKKDTIDPISVRMLNRDDVPTLWLFQKKYAAGDMRTYASSCALDSDLYLQKTVPAAEDMSPDSILGVFVDGEMVGYAQFDHSTETDILYLSDRVLEYLQMCDYKDIDCITLNNMFFLESHNTPALVKTISDRISRKLKKPIYIHFSDQMEEIAPNKYKSVGIFASPFDCTVFIPQKEYLRQQEYYEAVVAAGIPLDGECDD